MSRKSYRVDTLPVTRIPTRREIEWAGQRRAAGGAVDGERGLFLLNGGQDALGGHRALGAPIQSQMGAAGIARIGAAEARREDPYAYMDYQAVRDHLARLNDERGLGLSDVEVSRLAQERHNAARERRRKFDRYAGDPRYQPGASASRVDFLWDRPLEWDEQEAVPGAVRRGPRPQDGRGKAKSAGSRTAQRAKTFDKVTRQDAKGGRTSRADVLGGSTFRKEWEDGSYITRGEGNGPYQWYNKDGSLRGEAKDYKEIGANGRVFFGDLSTGEGKVTIGGDQRNETLVRNFKDADGTASYDTYQIRNGKEYKGASRSFTYGADGRLAEATHKIDADYGHVGGASLVVTGGLKRVGNDSSMTIQDTTVSREDGLAFDYEPPPSEKGPKDDFAEEPQSASLPISSDNRTLTAAPDFVKSGSLKDVLKTARSLDAYAKPPTDQQRLDYLSKQSGDVANYLDKQQGIDLTGAGKALDAAAGRVGVGGGGQAAEDALKAAKGVYADQYARSRANLDIARLGDGSGDYLGAGRAAATARSGQAMARARGWGGGETTVKMGGPNGPIFASGDSDAIAATLGRQPFWTTGGRRGSGGRPAVASIPGSGGGWGSGRKRSNSVDNVEEFIRNADDKGGSTRRDLFVDAADPTTQGPNTNTVRGRIESFMGEKENAAYDRIQKAFEAKNGRKMDVDTARLRAMMETGLLSRKDVLSLGKELRAERDMSIAGQLAAQAVGDMPRDAMGYVVSQELDPGRRLGRDDTFENAQRRVASVLNNGLRRDLSDAQRLFLAHRYGLVPEVRRVVAFDHAPGFGGEYGTVERGRMPIATYAPGSFYQPGTCRVLEAGSPELARAMQIEEQTSRQLGQLDSADALFSRLTARHIADAARRVTSAVRRKPESRRAVNRLVPLADADAPAAWWERTGAWAPAGWNRGIADPNWRRVRAAGTNQDAKGGKGR